MPEAPLRTSNNGLVVAGECTLLVEGTERWLVAWDFFYCAPETEHTIVAAGGHSASCSRWARAGGG